MLGALCVLLVLTGFLIAYLIILTRKDEIDNHGHIPITFFSSKTFIVRLNLDFCLLIQQKK